MFYLIGSQLRKLLNIYDAQQNFFGKKYKPQDIINYTYGKVEDILSLLACEMVRFFHNFATMKLALLFLKETPVSLGYREKTQAYHYHNILFGVTFYLNLLLKLRIYRNLKPKPNTKNLTILTTIVNCYALRLYTSMFSWLFLKLGLSTINYIPKSSRFLRTASKICSFKWLYSHNYILVFSGAKKFHLKLHSLRKVCVTDNNFFKQTG